MRVSRPLGACSLFSLWFLLSPSHKHAHSALHPLFNFCQLIPVLTRSPSHFLVLVFPRSLVRPFFFTALWVGFMGAAFHRFASAGLVSSDLFDAPYFARYASEFPVIFGDKIRAAFQLMYSLRHTETRARGTCWHCNKCDVSLLLL